LKVPRIGDPIVFELDTATSTVSRWSYLQHYIDLLAQRYGTEFAVAA
jgi:hypothetical protein